MKLKSIGTAINRAPRFAKVAALVAVAILCTTTPIFAVALPTDSFGWLTTIKNWVVGPAGLIVGTILLAIGGFTVYFTKSFSGVVWVLAALGIAFGAPGFIGTFFPNAGSSGALLPL